MRGFNSHMKSAMDGYFKLQRSGAKKEKAASTGRGFDKKEGDGIVPAQKPSRNSAEGKSKGGKVRKKEMNEMIFANNI